MEYLLQKIQKKEGWESGGNDFDEIYIPLPCSGPVHLPSNIPSVNLHGTDQWVDDWIHY